MTPLRRREVLAVTTAAALNPRLAWGMPKMTDMILVNAQVTTLDRENPVAEAVAIRDGKFLAVGSEAQVRTAAAPDATVIDGARRRLIPGLIDSHIHVIR